MPPSEIRREAREALRGKWGKAILLLLAFFIFNFALGFIGPILGAISPALFFLLQIGILIFTLPFSFGFLISFMKLKRDEEVKAFGFIKEGFSHFGKSWGIWFHTFIRLLLPALCIFALMALMMAMTIYNTSNMLNGATVSSTPNMGLSLIFTILEIACIIYTISRAFLYVIAYNIGYDNPNLSSQECVRKSAKLMKGHRGSYFLLMLSFIGWAILSSFTFGIGMLWLFPYIQVASVCFYERVAKVDAPVIEE